MSIYIIIIIIIIIWIHICQYRLIYIYIYIYTGLGRSSIDIPVGQRVIMQISPSNKGVYQMLSWTNTGAEYARTFTGQPLALLSNALDAL